MRGLHCIAYIMVGHPHLPRGRRLSSHLGSVVQGVGSLTLMLYLRLLLCLSWSSSSCFTTGPGWPSLLRHSDQVDVRHERSRSPTASLPALHEVISLRDSLPHLNFPTFAPIIFDVLRSLAALKPALHPRVRPCQVLIPAMLPCRLATFAHRCRRHCFRCA